MPTTPSGWGLGSWGTSPWGTGLVSPPADSLGRVYATGDRTVRVDLTFEPAHTTGTAEGDALNPRTWMVYRQDAGFRYSILAVRQLSPTSYELTTLQLLENAFVTLRAGSTTLRTVTGAPVLNFDLPFQGTVATVNATQQAQTSAAGYALRDVANPQTPNSPVGGTLEVTAAGDYKSVTGAPLIKKLIIRRLMSKPGDFFHLPAYGLGLNEKIPMAATDMRRLAKEIEDQVKLEPEVDAVRASLSLIAATQTLVVQMQVRLRQTGETVAVGLSVSTAPIQL